MRPILPALILALSASAAQAASFDCARARAPDERAVCADRALNDADVKLATMYGLIRGLFAMGMQGTMGDEQRAWIAQRRRCGADRACLRAIYDSRIGALQATYDHIDRPI